MRAERETVIKIHNLSYRYPGYNTVPVTALSRINLEITKGQKVLIAGHSGSGKSSLLMCINGLIPNSNRKETEFSGDVIIAGMNTRIHPVAEISGTVGTVFQNSDQQIVTNSVESEIAFGLENKCIPPEEIEIRIGKIAKIMRIGHLLERETHDLSWGEKQKVAIASVLVMEPEIIVMDEPFSGLDPLSSENLENILIMLNKKLNLTLIIAEHRTEQVSRLVDRIIILEKGKTIYDGPPVKNPNSIVEPHGVFLPGTGSGTEERLSFIQNLPKKCPPGKCPAIELINISYTYPGSPSYAVENLSLKLYETMITVILGSNGSGKSTLARHLNGILKPDSGKILHFGEDISGLKKKDIIKNVGLISQHADHQLFEESIPEEFSFGPVNLGIPKDEISRRIPGIISALDLNHIDINTPPLRLSAGEKQRVAIGSILIMDTPVVVLDEPTMGLDKKLKIRLSSELKKKCRNHHCIIIMTHDLEFASLCADRIVVMDNGKISYDSIDCTA